MEEVLNERLTAPSAPEEFLSRSHALSKCMPVGEAAGAALLRRIPS